MCRCSSWGPGLVLTLAVLGELVGLRILDTFSSISNSIIPKFSYCMTSHHVPCEMSQHLWGEAGAHIEVGRREGVQD